MSRKLHTPELPPCAPSLCLLSPSSLFSLHQESELPVLLPQIQGYRPQASSLRARDLRLRCPSPDPILSVPGVQTLALLQTQRSRPQSYSLRPQTCSLRPKGSGLRSPLSDPGVHTQTSFPRQGAVWLLSALLGSFLGRKHIHPAQICPDVCEESRLHSLCSAPQGPLTIHTHRELPNLLGDSSPDDFNCVHPGIIQSCREDVWRGLADPPLLTPRGRWTPSWNREDCAGRLPPGVSETSEPFL